MKQIDEKLENKIKVIGLFTTAVSSEDQFVIFTHLNAKIQL